jgi:hypothetical protein
VTERAIEPGEVASVLVVLHDAGNGAWMAAPMKAVPHHGKDAVALDRVARFIRPSAKDTLLHARGVGAFPKRAAWQEWVRKWKRSGLRSYFFLPPMPPIMSPFIPPFPMPPPPPVPLMSPLASV